MRITIAAVAMAAITLVAMSMVFGDNVLPFSLNLSEVVADPVEETAPVVNSSSSLTMSTAVQTQSQIQDETFSKGYAGAGCASGLGH
jgi:hypothetical protein